MPPSDHNSILKPLQEDYTSKCGAKVVFFDSDASNNLLSMFSVMKIMDVIVRIEGEDTCFVYKDRFERLPQLQVPLTTLYAYYPPAGRESLPETDFDG